MKYLPHLFICLGQERVQRRVVFAGPGILPEGRLTHALRQVPARHDPLHEQRQLRTHKQHQPLGIFDVQRFRCPGRLRDIGQRHRLVFIPHLRRQPHFQPQHQCQPGCRYQPVDIQPADPHCAAVQVVPDDLQLALHHLRIKIRPPIAGHHAPHIVTDTFSFHCIAPSGHISGS